MSENLCYVETSNLLDELFKRYDGSLFVGMRNKTYSHDEYTIKYDGDEGDLDDMMAFAEDEIFGCIYLDSDDDEAADWIDGGDNDVA